eukprot:COSAG02_NODE_1635_length_11556_cov_149.231300_2_plen_120_part_00
MTIHEYSTLGLHVFLPHTDHGLQSARVLSASVLPRACPPASVLPACVLTVVVWAGTEKGQRRPLPLLVPEAEKGPVDPLVRASFQPVPSVSLLFEPLFFCRSVGCDLLIVNSVVLDQLR